MEENIKIKILRQCPLFSALSEPELRQVSAITQPREYAKNHIIFYQDESCQGFYLLVEGMVKIYRISPDGKEQILFIVQPRNTFAEASLFLGGQYPANAQTLQKSLLFFFPKQSFLQLMKSDINLTLKMMAGLSQWLHRLVNLVDNLTLKDAEGRLAGYLLGLIKENKTDNIKIQLPIAKHLLAAQLGITSETLSRIFHKFQENHLIQMDGKIIFILNPSKLQQLIESE